MRKFRRIFRRVADPRAANAQHNLLELLVVALAATLCGAEGCSDMADFGGAKEGVLRLFLRLEHGIPSHDTFSRVFRLLDPQAFEAAFRRFMAAFAQANKLDLSGVVAIDGKALRGAFERGQRTAPLHLVNVWAVQARMVIAQHKAPGRNEAAGALEALRLLSLQGCIVTADALHCHRAMAQTIVDRGGDYVLAIKANRRPLFRIVAQQFSRAGARHTATWREPATHDRCETRRATIMRNASLAAVHRFPGVVAIGRITAAPASAWPACRPAAGALLSVVQIHVRRTLPANHPQSLDHRKPASLGARRPIQRGWRSRKKGQRTREPCHPAQARTQHLALTS
jgi:predicted transposase YbfD/YdcC